MINQSDLYSILKEKIPGIQEELFHAGDTTCPYKLAAFFASYTKKLMRLGNIQEVKLCFQVAEHFLLYGDYGVRNAIENVYIYSVTQALTFDHSFSIGFPFLFGEEYKKQVNTTGI